MKKLIIIILLLILLGIVNWVGSKQTDYERKQAETPVTIMTWIASRYSYWVQWHPNRSSERNTCAFHHQFKDYGNYKVTNLDTGKSIICWNNDWMHREDRLVDLSDHAFKELAPLHKWLIRVSVEKIF